MESDIPRTLEEAVTGPARRRADTVVLFVLGILGLLLLLTVAYALGTAVTGG